MNYQCRKVYSSSSSSHNCQPENNNNNNLDQISFLLGEHIPTSITSSASTACGVGSLGLDSHHMTFSSSCYNTSSAAAIGSSSSAEAGNVYRSVGALGGLYQGTLLASTDNSRGKSHLEQDLDSLDCDSEDGVGIFEEAVKQAPTRSYGSKRGRAAEVHNLSEKRRRSKINEKMKALQNLIPNSNKTDKASMLDEAIEYLKQLQLQVQMLSMRNGLSLHPMYLSGALHPLQSPEMCISLGLDADIAMNIGTGMLPLHHDSAAQSSVVLNHSTSAHQHTVMRSFANMTNPESSAMMESSQNLHGPPFRLPLSHEETISNGVVSQQHVVAAQSKRNAIGNVQGSVPINNSRQFGGQASMLGEGCMLGGERPQDRQPDNSGRVQHLNGQVFQVIDCYIFVCRQEPFNSNYFYLVQQLTERISGEDET